MRLEMDIRINAFPKGRGHIFGCGRTNKERYPAIFIHKKAATGFIVQFTDEDDWDRGTKTGDVTTNTWYRLRMDITETTFRVYVNHELKYNERKSRHNTYDDMVCYFSNPWFDAADVEVKNLKYYPLSGWYMSMPMMYSCC